MTNQKEVFFHVGLGKTASTYLQYQFFPKLKGIKYFQRSKYKRYAKIIEQSNWNRYFFSREFDRQFEKEVTGIAQHYPHAGIIIILRRHDSWMASQYRRYVKNGGHKSFGDFFHLHDENGEWQSKDVYFYPKLQLIDKLFHKKPLVLFHDDLKKDPLAFFDKMANYLGASYDKNKVSLSPVHKSYNLKQLLIMRRLGGLLFRKRKPASKHNFVNYIRYRSRWLFCHGVLYAAPLLPNSLTKNQELINPAFLQEIKDYFTDDWQKCIEFNNNLH